MIIQKYLHNQLLPKQELIIACQLIMYALLTNKLITGYSPRQFFNIHAPM